MQILLGLIALFLAFVIVKRYIKIKYQYPLIIDDALLNYDELYHHAREVAREHKVSVKKKNSEFLLLRFSDNIEFISKIYKAVNDNAREKLPICPASEWLLDNFYIIEEQAKDLQLNLSKSFFKELKFLENGYYKEYPRIFAVALEMVSHTDGKIEEDKLINFINEYQSQNYLTMPELWALSPMFRMAIIEKIRKICETIINTQSQWKEVEKLRDRDYNDIVSEASRHISAMKNIEYSYIEYLLKFFKKEGISQDEILEIINNKLIEFDTDIDKVIHREHQEQASLQISIGNCITSLRLIISMQWEKIFESLSVVEEILQDDPSGIYGLQDFESRNYYRKKIEKISRRCHTAEIKIAREAVECARAAEKNINDPRYSHIGYYILGRGRKNLILKLGKRNFVTFLKENSLSLYIGPIFAFTVIAAILLGIYSYRSSTSIGMGLLAFLAVLIPLSDIFVSIANWIVTRFTEPSFLPKLELKEGVSEDKTTIVIVPTILPNEKRVRDLVDHLEVTYLANREKHVFFALVGDYKDSETEYVHGDKEIADTALSMIKDLNKKYSPDMDIFFFFLRKRIYSKPQNRWMGWERKRGAIVEFNDLVKGAENTNYSIVSGDVSLLRKARYVITLDADTIMTIGTARRLIGTISHPLNAPVLNARRGIVTEGYGIIQPRIGINIESSSKSLFTRIFAGHGGIDTYATAVSDVYQDLFEEGIFTGKGIYDIDTFRDALNRAIPENSVLSHDLLEGSYLRTGLTTDIELIDGYPEKYSSYMMRLHRWVRGDWQLVKWLFPYITNRDGRRVKNPLSLLSKWKIFDNLRRSTISINLIVIFILGLSILPGNMFVWTGIGMLTLIFPLFNGFINYLFMKYYSISIERANGNVIQGFRAALLQMVLNFIFLPYNCYMMFNAIYKTLYRVFFSKKNLLEWVTAADMEKNLKNDLKSYTRRMYPSFILAVVLILSAAFLRPSNIMPSIFLAVVWALSPYVAYAISRLEGKTSFKPGPEDIQLLRRLSRKTWAFYEDFAGADNNYLPIDNYQEEPVDRIAHRTSPTNIGFLLISILSARDFGYISTSNMIERITNSLDTIEKLDKWRGHLYNWYDTKTLEVLRPQYISTVDSGNLVGYYITLRQGISQYLYSPLIDERLASGLMETIELACGDSGETLPRIKELASEESFSVSGWYRFLGSIKVYFSSPKAWGKKTAAAITGFRKEIEEVFPRYIFETESSQAFGIEEIDEEIGITARAVEDDTSLLNMRNLYEKLISKIDTLVDWEGNKVPSGLEDFVNGLESAKKNIEEKIDFFKNLLCRIDRLIDETEFTPLYDFKRGVFSIGYNVETDKLTNSYYDLLASESRIASYIAVIKREIPVSHWFRLGRALVLINGYKSLVSWTGTMFEYFMPPLIMKSYPNTLLSETYFTVIRAQIKYGKNRNVPWGTSESGYNTFDLALNYQYKAFGVPDLGLKRGLINDMVISPYSTALALPHSPGESLKNLWVLISNSIEGAYGLYESIDYTPERLNNVHGEGKAVVKSYMAHHQGMSFIAFNNYLNNNIMVERFHSSPLVKSGEFLLQEKIPFRILVTKEIKEKVEPFDKVEYRDIDIVRKAGIFDTPIPVCHLLSNGTYSLMVNNSGSGYSKNDGIQLTRWREDSSIRNSGMFFYIRDLKSNKAWSSAYEPLKAVPDKYDALFSQDKAEFIRRDGSIETHSEICVSPEDNCEIRKITIANHGHEEAVIECTSYFELVLASHSADVAHPTFSNLFVRTQAFEDCCGLIASRRPREENSQTLWALHTLVVEGETIGDIEYETDRYKFVGRGRTTSNPISLNRPLSNSTGPVLDPVMSLRRKVRIPAGKSASFSFATGMAHSREGAVEIIKKYSEQSNIYRAFELAYIRSQMETRYLNLKAADVEQFDEMISHIIYINPKRRDYRDLLLKNSKGQPGLWPYGISGDIPIALVSIKSTEDIEIVKEMIKAHEYWRSKGLTADLVILNEDEGSYLQPLQDLLREVVFISHARDILDRPGGIFIKNANIMPIEDKILFYTAARLIIKAERGKIGAQIDLKDYEAVYRSENSKAADITEYALKEEHPAVHFFNSFGGFDINNKEYVMTLTDGIYTPAPWSNVVCSERFGFIITESGSGHTWFENSRENKLTPWSNDPVSDPPGEVIYIKDNDTGEFWSITPLPVREKESYIIAHGLGYSRFQHSSHGLNQELTLFVPEHDSLKISMIKLKNTSGSRRSLSIYYFMRPVLGVSDQMTQLFITTDVNVGTGTMFFKNSFNSDYPGYTAFIASSLDIKGCTGDRMEFIGIYGSLDSPEGIKKPLLSGQTGAGYDPCGAIHSILELEEGEESEFVLLFGQERSRDEAETLATRYKNIDECKKALIKSKMFWRNVLETVHVKTPDTEMDLMLNYWLLYQNISCRIWARSAFYQSGGAYGFRDQLQDVLSVMNTLPELARKQILLHCSHQFLEGDVQHWWHPGISDKGIRTRFSDDLVWLPYVTSVYIQKTGDTSLLYEETPFLEESPLQENEDERYGIPGVSSEKASVYEHCIRAIEKSLKMGEHGIPLMGSGDWNDGMNTVGNKGRGESIWLGWFQYSTLVQFSEVCRIMKEDERAERYIKTASEISSHIEENAWDGEWYRRAYFDNGIPLGSALNTECKIDSLAQSWAVISGAGDRDRIISSMKALEDYLINREDGLILLFTPPFDRGDLKPGYIRGYVPGVRENGGQYTHAATWVIYAYAKMGYGDKAHELFHMINPINHTRTQMECMRYKVEPYVMAADVYAVKPHTGRGGWTWYTGSAGWMYQVGLEHILGFNKFGDKILFNPSVPRNWKEYSIKYKYNDSTYNIIVKNPDGVNAGVKNVIIDGNTLEGNELPLVNDSKEHNVEVIMG